MEIVTNFDSARDRESVNRYLSSLKGEWVVTVKKKKRTLRQLRYYWGVVIPVLVKEIGEPNDVIHEYMKFRYLKELRHIKGQEFYHIRDTGELTTAEFATFVDAVIRFAAEQFGAYIPDADSNILVR